MAMRDLIPWNRGREVSTRRGENADPFLTLHREMNRLFDDVLRGFDLAPFGAADPFFDRTAGLAADWPRVEVGETDKEIKVTAELPGMDEKDVDVALSGGALVIRGEKKSETEDKERRFSERSYGSFERRIPVDDIEEDKVSASFKNGVLTVVLPKIETARDNVKRIAITGR